MKIHSRIGLFAGLVCLTGCNEVDITRVASDYPLSAYKRSQLIPKEKETPFQMSEDQAKRTEFEQKLKEQLDKRYLPPSRGKGLAVRDSEYLLVRTGAELYHKNCVTCHGVNGGAETEVAAHMMPRPRDYRRGLFKWKATARSQKPTKTDIQRVIHEGAVGSAMPSFRLLAPADQLALTEYVIFLSKRGEFERRVLLKVEEDQEFPNEKACDDIQSAIEKTWDEATGVKPEKPDPFDPEEKYDPAKLEAAIKAGKELFLGEKAGCAKCHGRDGRGDPNQVVDKTQLVDDWGYLNYPRNLHWGFYRGGRKPADLFRRVHQGISGAAMPEGNKNLSTDEIWAIVHFVKALPYRPELLKDVGPAPTTPPAAGANKPTPATN